MKHTASACLLLLSLCLGSAQAQHAAAQTVSGCVAHLQTGASKYVLAAGDRCMLLAGAFDAAQVADHRITVTGVVTEPTGLIPLTLTVKSVTSTLEACSKTCVLEPPGTRGIHGKERPGAEGGTPGLHAPAEQPPQ